MNLDQETSALLCKIAGIFENLRYRYSVIGATAFLIHQVDLTRTTRDIDFSILLNGDWYDFEEMKRYFTLEGFHFTKIPHRMKTGDGFIIDLLPVGAGIIKDGSIFWPDGVVMNANGLQEAIENAILIDIGQCTVPVAALPVLALLKLFAFEDCRELKHIKDILRCFIFYEKERRFDLLADEIPGLTYENAGAFLLGRDLRSIISGRQLNSVKAIIFDIESKPLLGEAEIELLTFFQSGLNGPEIQSR